MKKLLLTIILVSGLFAGNTTEDFFYQNGYEQGVRDGFNKGVNEAFKEAKKIIKAYKDEIKAYEIGKYLVKKRYLTAPKIYQVIDKDNDIRLRIEPSKVIKELSIEDIFAKFGNIPTLRENDLLSDKTQDINEVNSVNIANRDEVKNLPGVANKNNKIITISLERNSKNENILKKANVVYSLDKNRLKAMFFSRAEKNHFCKSFGICR